MEIYKKVLADYNDKSPKGNKKERRREVYITK